MSKGPSLITRTIKELRRLTREIQWTVTALHDTADSLEGTDARETQPDPTKRPKPKRKRKARK